MIMPGFEVIDYVFRRDNLCSEALRAASRVCWSRFTEFGAAYAAYCWYENDARNCAHYDN